MVVDTRGKEAELVLQIPSALEEAGRLVLIATVSSTMMKGASISRSPKLKLNGIGCSHLIVENIEGKLEPGQQYHV